MSKMVEYLPSKHKTEFKTLALPKNKWLQMFNICPIQKNSDHKKDGDDNEDDEGQHHVNMYVPVMCSNGLHVWTNLISKTIQWTGAIITSMLLVKSLVFSHVHVASDRRRTWAQVCTW
jgi:hypothetical protein